MSPASGVASRKKKRRATSRSRSRTGHVEISPLRRRRRTVELSLVHVVIRRRRYYQGVPIAARFASENRSSTCRRMREPFANLPRIEENAESESARNVNFSMTLGLVAIRMLRLLRHRNRSATKHRVARRQRESFNQVGRSASDESFYNLKKKKEKRR